MKITYNRSQITGQSGQVVIILLLVVVLALAIALSVIGRSVTEVSTAVKSEDASRAFSAAEAGIEKAILQNPVPGVGTAGSASLGGSTLSNQSEVQVAWNPVLPPPKTALEYPAFGKESFAQFWMASPSNTASYYIRSSFDVYFGNPAPSGDTNYYINNPSDKPAIEVNLIYQDGSSGYASYRQLYDSNSQRATTNDWPNKQGCASSPATTLTNDYSSARSFYCRIRVTGYPLGVSGVGTSTGTYPVMVRVRTLYSGISHPVAVKPLDDCASGCSLPPQTSIFRSTGSAGEVQRRLQVFQQGMVMPQIFDYALFSAGTLSK